MVGHARWLACSIYFQGNTGKIPGKDWSGRGFDRLIGLVSYQYILQNVRFIQDILPRNFWWISWAGSTTGTLYFGHTRNGNALILEM